MFHYTALTKSKFGIIFLVVCVCVCVDLNVFYRRKQKSPQHIKFTFWTKFQTRANKTGHTYHSDNKKFIYIRTANLLSILYIVSSMVCTIEIVCSLCCLLIDLHFIFRILHSQKISIYIFHFGKSVHNFGRFFLRLFPFAVRASAALAEILYMYFFSLLFRFRQNWTHQKKNKETKKQIPIFLFCFGKKMSVNCWGVVNIYLNKKTRKYIIIYRRIHTIRSKAQ